MTEQERITSVREFIGELTNEDAWRLRGATGLEAARDVLLARLAVSAECAAPRGTSEDT